MANDISLCVSDQPIKNGTMLVQCKVTGSTIHDKYDYYVSNSPSIATIESRYDNRFDDPSYYYGGGAGVDGGDVGGDVLGV